MGEEPPRRRRRLRLPETPIPPDFKLSEDLLAFALKNLDEREAREEFALFKNHHLAVGNLRANWPACWRTWCIRHVKIRRQREARV